MMAAVAIGVYGDMPACVEAWVTPSLGAVTAPDPDVSRFYSNLYSVYRAIRETMPPAWSALGRARREHAN